MAVNFITGFVGTQTLASSSTLIVTQEGVITSNTNGVTDTGYNTRVSIFGEIHTEGYGLRLDNVSGFSTGSHTVDVGEDGVISSADQNAVYLAGNVNKVDNAGEIINGTGSGLAAVFLSGNNADVTNTGTIRGSYGISNVGTSAADRLDVINHGSIYGSQYGLNVNTQNLDLFNSGIIQGLTHAVRLTTAGTDAHIVNTGLIETSDGIAIDLNSGNDEVINTGMIVGHILMGSGNDTFDGRGGKVIGLVSGDQGDDNYYISDSDIQLTEGVGFGTDSVYSTVSYRLGDNFENLTLLTHKNINGVGNNGANSLIGNAGNNRLQGQAGNDVLNGAHGDDKLLGSFGNDTLQGGKGDDILKGGVDNDYLHLGNGDDIGIGGAGNDTILGVRGDDILKGGVGQDTMTGGLGDDVFLFTRKGHSTNAAADSITDFTSGADVIDLSAFNGTFDFIGNAAFSGTAKEVRFFSVGADRTVKIDINGDGSTDMTILVNSATALVELDFVL